MDYICLQMTLGKNQEQVFVGLWLPCEYYNLQSINQSIYLTWSECLAKS